jgi:hypothetical protein
MFNICLIKIDMFIIANGIEMKNDDIEKVSQDTDGVDNVDIDTQEMLPILLIRSVVAFPHMNVPAMISSSSAPLIEAAHQSEPFNQM